MKKYSFIDLFKKDIEIVGLDKSVKYAKINKIIIPKIQRDYAQGRKSAGNIRREFLKTLKEALNGEKITLDFIYGDINNNGIFTPLDGQQRLTTLFLIHWYAAKKESIKEECDFLQNFSYETRMSSRDFCESIILYFQPDFNSDKELIYQIQNQMWFPDEWLKDPTIKSMLNMIDAIHKVFKDVDNLWEKLKSDCITFYVLLIEEMGITDDIYIKMNSRGRPLTDLEIFKATLEKTIEDVNADLRKEIAFKFDDSWTALFWRYKDKNNNIDDRFINFFMFIFKVLCYENGFSRVQLPCLLDEYFDEDEEEVLYNDEDELIVDKSKLINIFYSNKIEEKEEIFRNIDPYKSLKTMENYFDIVYEMYENSCGLESYFSRYFSKEHSMGRILYDEKQIDLFIDYLTKKSSEYRKFVLLYTFINYELMRKNGEATNNFSRILRIINNLTLNSANELSDRGINKNYLPYMLKEVKKLIKSGFDDIDFDKTTGFNSKQLQEEKIKLEWTRNNPNSVDVLYKLEDSKFFSGRIGVLAKDNYVFDYNILNKAIRLFDCDVEKISCALLTFGKYGVRRTSGSKIIYHFGKITGNDSENRASWQKVLCTLDDESFKKTQRILQLLLASNDYFTNDYLDELKNKYIEECVTKSEYDWRYYFLKYKKIRESDYGTYFWLDENNSCDFNIMTTKEKPSQYAYNVYLWALDDNKKLGHESFDSVKVNGHTVKIINNICYIDEHEYEISQKELYDGNNKIIVDTEDRIIKINNIINNI